VRGKPEPIPTSSKIERSGEGCQTEAMSPIGPPQIRGVNTDGATSKT
jgi:hypothetical protein